MIAGVVASRRGVSSNVVHKSQRERHPEAARQRVAPRSGTGGRSRRPLTVLAHDAGHCPCLRAGVSMEYPGTLGCVTVGLRD